jgi:hypothetical protein
VEINIIPNLVKDFLKSIEHLVGLVNFSFIESIDAARFPYEIYKLNEQHSGVYIFYRKDNNRILYIGISKDITGRFWKHLGSNFLWEKEGGKASFPNFSLSKGRHWLSEETTEIFRKALFNVAVINLDPWEISASVESFLIFYGFVKGFRPELNVEF